MVTFIGKEQLTARFGNKKVIIVIDGEYTTENQSIIDYLRNVGIPEKTGNEVIQEIEPVKEPIQDELEVPEELSELDQLKLEANALGVKYGKNIGIETLKKRIAEARDAR